jgi:thiamine-monophosphate kinase
MPLSEFALIQHYFSQIGPRRRDVLLGVGDDCALLEPWGGGVLAMTTDTLVEGVHFPAGVDPESLGHKALAVNLSDLAAMGAEPAWATLALTLPTSDAAWLEGFSRGFAALAQRHGVALVGGDTTRGPLAINIHVSGFVPRDEALRRDRARPGDSIFVSGTLGDAALALKVLNREYRPADGAEALLERLHRPTPRVSLGKMLRGLANAAIDISDGLLADLGHICEQSGVGAEIRPERLPLSAGGRAWRAAGGDWSPLLAGGDDYELCFTLPAERRAAFEARCFDWPSGLTEIGVIQAGSGVRCRLEDGRLLHLEGAGYDHFSQG